MHAAAPRKRWRPGRTTLLVTIGTAVGILGGYLGWTLDQTYFEWQYARLVVAVVCVAVAVALYVSAILLFYDDPAENYFPPQYQRLAITRWLEKLETEKKNARIRDIMRDVVGNPED